MPLTHGNQPIYQNQDVVLALIFEPPNRLMVLNNFKKSALVLICVFDLVDGVSRSQKQKRAQDFQDALIGTLSGIFFMIMLFGCYYCWNQVFPRENMFTSLELDDIRLERLDERESMLNKKLETIQNQLTFHRRKKTEVQIRRDVTGKFVSWRYIWLI